MRAFLVLFLAIAGSLQAWAETINIYRDSWGVPHVYAETERGAAYGQGYAAAEDRLGDVLRNYREATGRLAEAFGPRYVQQDYIQRVAQHAAMAKAHFAEQPPEVRALLEAYVAGLKRYMKEHPEKVPAWTLDVEPWHPLALARHMIFGWPLGEANGKLGRRLAEITPRASNQWSISPSRTAEGAAMLLIDPHLSWAPLSRFHEVRLHGGELHLSGASIPGAPMVALGHNRYLGWAATTGGPSTSDIYEEELNPANPLQYKYDGQWRDIRVEKVAINVKTDAGMKTESREIRFTHHGPILVTNGNRAYAAKIPYLDQVLICAALYRQSKARTLEEFKAAMDMGQWMQQNIMYADVAGNIFYLRTGRVPIRPKGYDWSRPVPGNTSSTEWRGLHPQKDLVQVLNPADGYMQNCNADPMTMMAHPPFKPSDYPDYIYNSTPYSYNPRAERAREVLDANHRMTLQDAMALVLDTFVDGAPRYQAALQAAAAAATDTALLDAVRNPLRVLLSWNGRLEIDSLGSVLFDTFVAQAIQLGVTEQDRAAIRQGAPLAPEKQKALLEALRKAADAMQRQYGAIEVPWGNVRRVARGQLSFPVAGGGAGGISTLRAVSFDSPNEKGERVGAGGQFMTTLIIFKKTGAESYSATPWGQSDDPDSAHFADQAEKLFSRKALKPTWFDKKQLMPHVASSKTLEM